MNQPTSPEEPLPRPSGRGGQNVSYREVLRAAWWVWLIGAGFALTIAIAFVPLHPLAGLGGLLVGAALAVWGIVRWTLRIEISDGILQVHKARVPVTVLGEARTLDQAEMRSERGPRLDARAYLELRLWTPTGVRIDLCDPQDPTPYWLVSSRRPQEFVAALRAAQGAGRPAAR